MLRTAQYENGGIIKFNSALLRLLMCKQTKRHTLQLALCGINNKVYSMGCY